ncbi:FtsX-like permease family protein [Kitasatospora arboriphila]
MQAAADARSRIREFAVLRAIGVAPGQLAAVLRTEMLTLTGLAVLLGAVLGLLSAALLLPLVVVDGSAAAVFPALRTGPGWAATAATALATGALVGAGSSVLARRFARVDLARTLRTGRTDDRRPVAAGRFAPTAAVRAAVRSGGGPGGARRRLGAVVRPASHPGAGPGGRAGRGRRAAGHRPLGPAAAATDDGASVAPKFGTLEGDLARLAEGCAAAPAPGWRRSSGRRPPGSRPAWCPSSGTASAGRTAPRRPHSWCTPRTPAASCAGPRAGLRAPRWAIRRRPRSRSPSRRRTRTSSAWPPAAR